MDLGLLKNANNNNNIKNFHCSYPLTHHGQVLSECNNLTGTGLIIAPVMKLGAKFKKSMNFELSDAHARQQWILYCKFLDLM